jgi:hypothetical protein
VHQSRLPRCAHGGGLDDHQVLLPVRVSPTLETSSRWYSIGYSTGARFGSQRTQRTQYRRRTRHPSPPGGRATWLLVGAAMCCDVTCEPAVYRRAEALAGLPARAGCAVPQHVGGDRRDGCHQLLVCAAVPAHVRTCDPPHAEASCAPAGPGPPQHAARRWAG